MSKTLLDKIIASGGCKRLKSYIAGDDLDLLKSELNRLDFTLEDIDDCIINDGFGDHQTMLMLSAESDACFVTRYLIEQGAALDQLSPVDHYSAAMFAARYGADKALRILLDAGVNIESTRVGARTPLQLAIHQYAVDKYDDLLRCAKLLVDRGADLNQHYPDTGDPNEFPSPNDTPLSLLRDGAHHTALSELESIIIRKSARINDPGQRDLKSQPLGL